MAGKGLVGELQVSESDPGGGGPSVMEDREGGEDAVLDAKVEKIYKYVPLSLRIFPRGPRLIFDLNRKLDRRIVPGMSLSLRGKG